MAFFGKTYVLEKNEKFEEFLIAFGVPAEIVQEAVKATPTLKITKDGDTYTLSASDEKNKELKFVSGVDFEEQITSDIVAKKTITVEGNVVTQVQNFGNDRVLTTKREFKENSVLVTMTSNNWDGVCHRYYTAV